MKIKYGIFILTLFVMVLFSVMYSWQSYHRQRDLLIRGIDAKLYAAAVMARATLPENYHNDLSDSSSVSQETFDKIVTRYNELCLDLNLEYLWSLMEINRAIVFTTSTSPDKKTENRKHAKFFETHSNPEFFSDVLSSQEPHYKNIVSKWGKTRMALVPFQDGKKRPYLFGASMSLAEIDELLNSNIKDAVHMGIGLLIAGLILSYILARLLSKPLNSLAFETTLIASGKLNKKVEEGFFLEQAALARNFNKMVMSIKEKMADLAESEEKYRSMMEAMDDPCYICSKEFILEYMNPSMIRITGYDATGELCHKAIHGLDKKCPWCVHGNVMKGESVKQDNASPWNDRVFSVTSSPINHADKRVSKLTIFRDITEQKEMESSLQKSQRMEAIGTLAGGIAHDFNNILFPIVGHSEMIMEDLPDESPLRGSMDEIHRGALRARDLVQQILAFSRREEDELSQIRLQPIIKEALKLLRSTIPSTISISRDIQTDCGAVEADPTKIHQIIMNLSTNAYHAMEQAGGELKVRLRQMETTKSIQKELHIEPGSYAELTISDTGEGIDSRIIDKIFNPFFTTKERGRGTGMGLSVVHGIVKSMKGAVRVKSEPGRGSDFHIYLPVINDEYEETETLDTPVIAGGSEHLLIVDDERGIVSMEKKALERLGYKITSFTGSIEAFKLFKGSPYIFDLVITDMDMPEMTGDKLAAALKGIRPEIPVLICTGFRGNITEEKILSMGIDGLLIKPVTIRDLALKIRNTLDAA